MVLDLQCSINLSNRPSICKGDLLNKIEAVRPAEKCITFHSQAKMPSQDEPPKTKKQGHKSAKEKARGAERIGSGKGTRLAEANQQRPKNPKHK